MNKILRRVGIALAVIGLVLVVVCAAVYAVSAARLNKVYGVVPESIEIPTAPAAVARGRHLVESVAGCIGCHGTTLAGAEMFDVPLIGKVYSANLTAGRGGVGARFSDADFVRAIRHGVDPEGRPLFVMPAENFYNLSDEDLGAVIAYLKSLPPVDNELPASQLGPVGRLLLVAGGPGLLPAEAIAQAGPRPAAPAPGATADYGGYLVRVAGCKGCHGSELAGGHPQRPGAGLAPNLSPGAELAGWSAADFIQTLRTRVTPSQHALNADMPSEYGGMTDDELTAIYLYLQSLPALATAK